MTAPWRGRMLVPMAAHWDDAYATGDEERSWTQAQPARSIAALHRIGASRDAPIIDVGGGSSRLAAALIGEGFTDVTVLDVSGAALELARGRMGEDAARVRWLAADLLDWVPTRRYAVWHDRAVLHFFVEDDRRDRYAATLRAALAPGAHAVIATFGPGGPAECSGLPVRRYAADDVLALLGEEFSLVHADTETHRTPGGAPQEFTWVIARRG